MAGEESGGPERPEQLLVVVDVANIRPGKTPDDRPGRPNTPTSLAYIDLCLNEIQIAAPGAIVVKFADQSLLDAVTKPDRRELVRRSELHYSEPEKIFLVQYADRPVLAGAHLYEASIVSCDGFDDPELDELKTSDVRQFRHLYDKKSKIFSFPALHGGSSLEEWWKSTFEDVPETWFFSDEYLEIEWQLRSGIHDATFQYHSEPLTHRPKIPAPSLFTSHEIEPLAPMHDPEDRSARKAQPAVSRNLDRLPVVFLDDIPSVISASGSEALVVGRVATRPDGGTELRWFGNTTSARISQSPVPPSLQNGSWVSVPARVNSSGDSLWLETLDASQIKVLTFSQVLDMQAAGAGAPAEKMDGGRWQIPAFTRKVVQVARLKERRIASRESSRAGAQPEGNDQERRLPRFVPVFRNGHIEHEERSVTIAELDLATLRAQDDLDNWKKAKAEARENRRRRQTPTTGSGDEGDDWKEWYEKRKKQLEEAEKSRLENRRRLQTEVDPVQKPNRWRFIVLLLVICVVAAIIILITVSSDASAESLRPFLAAVACGGRSG